MPTNARLLALFGMKPRYTATLGRRVVLFGLLGVAFFQALAQQAPIRAFGLETGLPSTETHVVLQDHNGYIWVGTDRGLARFDGTSFSVYGQPEGLAEDVVVSLYEDPWKRLWATHLNGGISLWENGRWSVWRNAFVGQALARSTKHNTLRFWKNLAHGPGDTLWMTMRAGQVVGIAPDGTAVELSVRHPSATGFSVQGYRRGGGIQWAMADAETPGVLKDPAAPLASAPKPVSETPYTLHWAAVSRRAFQGHAVHAEPAEGVVVLGFERHLMRLEQGELREVHELPQVLGLTGDAEGGCWVATRGGLYRWRRPVSGTVPEAVLPGVPVSGVLLDREGGLWCTTLDRGLLYWPLPNLFLYPQNGMDHQLTGLLVEADSVYAGTYDGHLLAWDRQSGEGFRAWRAGNRSDVRHLVRDAQGRLWSSYERRGGYGQLPNKSAADWFPSGAFVVPRKDGRVLHVFGRVVETVNDTVDLISPVAMLDSQLLSVYAVLDRGAQDTLFLGTHAGLMAYSAGTFEDLRVHSERLRTKVSAMDSLDNGQLVLATRGHGLLLYRRDSTERLWPQRVPVSLNDVHIGQSGWWWLAGQTGVIGLRPKATPQGRLELEEWRILDAGLGMPSAECNRVVERDSVVYVASKGGLLRMDLRGWTDNAIPPPIHLERCRIAGKDTVVQERYRIPYRQRRVELRFAALSYRQDGVPPLRYRWAGRHAEWRYTDSRSLSLSALKPGSHRLEVQAANESGVWSNPSAAVELHIRLPWWRSPWFLVTVLGLLLGATILWSQWHSRQQAEARAMLDVRLKSLAAQLNPHFMFNALNGIQQFLVANEPAQAQRYLARFAKLMRGNLRQLSQERVSLAEDVEALEHFLQLENLRMDGRLDWRIELDKNLQPERIQVPGLMLQALVENAIWWGIAQRPDRSGRLRIRFSPGTGEGRRKPHVQVLVEDNGIGLKQAEALPEAIRRKRSNGAGLDMTRKRLALWGRRLKRHFVMELEELRPADLAFPGTRVRLELPILEGREHGMEG